MLNISPNSINKDFDQSKYDSLKHVNSLTTGNVYRKMLTAFAIVSIVVLFLPWTQNIRANGSITTIKPNQRPQTIHSIIDGRIEQWYVKEGDFVKKGDTILFISEIRDQFFDPQLLERTQMQLSAQEFSAESFSSKTKSLENQIEALKKTLDLKIQQANNKLRQAELSVESDSIDYQAAKINYEVATSQFQRLEKLYEKGLKSLTDLENRKNRMQEAQSNLIAAENKLLSSRNELLNAQIEINSTTAQYQDAIAKAESEKFTAISSMYSAEIGVTKLQNQFKNFSIRKGMYFITAPQDGYITKVIQAGIGETVKEGTPILSIMPSEVDLMVEMYVRPIDLPLIEKGRKVRIQFDGWPAIVFSGWPGTSYGTYGGTVYAMDQFISKNGMFRILVKPDSEDHPWPDALRVGGGTNNFLLLDDVPVWYELWRKINGFPPNFYNQENQDPLQTNSMK